MPKNHLVTIAWATVPVATFALGWFLKPATDDAGSASRAGDQLVAMQGDSKKSGERSKAVDPPARSSTATGALAALSTNAVGNGTPLSSAQITLLGEDFRNTLDPIARRTAFLKLLSGMTVENAKEIREQIEHLRPEDPDFRDFHYAWGKIGGMDAVMNGSETSKPDMHATLAGWASADPQAAQAWFDSLPEKGDKGYGNRGYLKAGLVNGLADSNPRFASDFVLGLVANGDPSAQHLMGIVTGKMLKLEGHTGAADWAESLPSGRIRTQAFQRIAQEFAGSDPKAAAEWAESFADHPEGDHVIGSVGTRWAHRQPEAAIEWLSDLPEGSGRDRAFGTAFSSWAGRNPQEAGNYINEMPQSPSRDAAITGYATRLAHENPSMAVAWAGSVSDPGARQEALVRTGQTYFRRNRAEAEQWLPTSGLSTEAKNRIRNGQAHGYDYQRKDR